MATEISHKGQRSTKKKANKLEITVTGMGSRLYVDQPTCVAAPRRRERHKDLPGDQGERKTRRPTWRPRREKDTKIYLATMARERHEDLPGDQGERKTRRPTWRPRREKDTKTYLATKARERHEDLPGDQGERKTRRPTWRPRREKDTKTYLSDFVHAGHHVLVQNVEHEDVSEQLGVLPIDLEDDLMVPDRVLRVLPYLALGLALTHAVDVHLHLHVGV